MESIYKEQEYEMIKRMLDLKIKLDLVEVESHYCNSSAESLENENSKKGFKAILEQINIELLGIENPLASKEILEILIQTFHNMIKEISVGNTNIPISKNQGLIIDNYFVLRILDEVKKIVILDFHGMNKPFLYGSTDPSDSFSRNDLIQFLGDEIAILNNFPNVNYILITDYFQEFQERLFSLID